MSGWTITSLAELDRILVVEGLEWRPIRRRLGVGSFGINAYTSSHVGGCVVEEHEEASGHEEVYLVVSGRATFTVDGEELAAPAGTVIFLPEGSVKRKAIAEEEGTTVLAIGGWPGKPFTPSSWEWYFAAYATDPAAGIELIEDGIRELGDLPAFQYHLACLLVKADRLDEAREHLARALAEKPDWATRVDTDEDLAPLRGLTAE